MSRACRGNSPQLTTFVTPPLIEKGAKTWWWFSATAASTIFMRSCWRDCARDLLNLAMAALLSGLQQP